MSDQVIVWSLFAVVLGVGAYRGFSRSLPDFLYNSNATRFPSLFTSTVAAQIGAGSVVTVYSISVYSPFTGMMIALGVGGGLLLLAGLLPRMYRIAESLQARGLLEIMIKSHGCSEGEARLFMIPISLIVLLKLSTQLLALSLLIDTVFAYGQIPSTLMAVILLLIYVLFAGYRAATSTDAMQFVVVLAFAGAVFVFLDRPQDFDYLARHERYPDYFPWVLFGMLLLTTVTSIPHWRRATTAADRNQARLAFLLAAPLVIAIILVFSLSGHLLGREHPNSAGGLQILFPPQLGWLVHAGMMMAIISSMDTLLLSTLIENERLTLRGVRLRVLAVGIVIFGVAIFLGDIVKTMVSTYSALLAFFPAAAMAMLGRAADGRVLIASVFAGIAASVATVFVNFILVPIAALGVSALAYFAVLAVRRATRPG